MINYSNETSRPPLNEITLNGKRQRQCDIVYECIKRGASCLKEIQNWMRYVPQAIISARVNDLIKEGKVEYNGFWEYEGRKRKQILLRTGQMKLF